MARWQPVKSMVRWRLQWPACPAAWEWRGSHWLVRLDLPQHQALAGGEGGDHVYRLLGIPGALGAAHRFAVYGDDAFRHAGQ